MIELFEHAVPVLIEGFWITLRIGLFSILFASLLAWHWAALAGFVLVGLGAANIVPVMFGAAGRLPGTSPGIAIATVTTLGYLGLLCGPALVGFAGYEGGQPVAIAVALIWTAHIGIDRALGYGLKYATAFGDTHLGQKGGAGGKKRR